MQRLLIVFLLGLLCFTGYSQAVLPLRADTVKIYKQGGHAELVLLNSTKDSTNGFLQNMGGGRTEFHTLGGAGFLINPMTSPNDMIRGGTSGIPTRVPAPAHAGMKLGYDGSVIKWYDTTAASGTPVWGSIGGTLSAQTDLQTALNGKQATITLGTTAQYFRGNLSLATFPTDLVSFTNGPGYVTSLNSTNSITGTGTVALPFKLNGDLASPGASEYYGTNSGGTKGWFAFPSLSTAITQLTGDVSAIGPGSAGATLATVNANVFGSNTFLKTAVNGKGLTTSAAAVTATDVATVLGFGANGDLFVGSGVGTGSILNHGTTNQVVSWNGSNIVWVTPASGFADPMTTAYDIIYRNGSNVTTRLGIGSNGQFLGVSGGVFGYFSPPSGFADPLTTNGDIIARISGATTRLPKGANNTVLNIDGTGLLNYALLTTSNLSNTAGITNAQLANSAVTVNGVSVSLGGSITIPSLIHGAKGNLLYYAPDGSAYTVAIQNDTAAGNFNFLHPIKFPTGLGSTYPIQDVIDNSSSHLFDVSGSSTNEVHFFNVDAIADEGFYNYQINRSSVVDAVSKTVFQTTAWQDAGELYGINPTFANYYYSGVSAITGGKSRYVLDYQTVATQKYATRVHLFQADSLGNVYFPSVTSGTVVSYFGVDAAGKMVTGTPGGSYTLPTASTTVLGGVKVDGTSITISGGVISASGGSSLATASGDATGTVSGTNLPLTFATVNSNVGTFGDATHVAQVTYNAKGLATAVSSVAITNTSPNSTISVSGLVIDVVHANSRPTSTVSTNTTFSLVAGDYIESIWVDPTSATTGFQVGTTSTGSDIVGNINLIAGSTNNFVVGYRATGATTLYFQNISSSTVITLIKQQ